MPSELDFSLLDESLGGEGEGNSENESPLVELKEGEIDPRYLRLSYSTNLLLHACPRKFQLKCLQAERQEDFSANVTFAFGHVVGFGIAHYMITKNLPLTLVKMLAQWEVEFFAENGKQKKSFPHAVHAIRMFASLVEDGYLSEYEVAEYDGKPAEELSFRIHIPTPAGDFTYRGYLDLVLRHLMTGEFAVLENKTNSGTWVNHYQYKNSAQGVGYGVILDKLEGDLSAYEVKYNIFMTKLNRYEDFDFPKSYHQRALWIRDLLWDIQTVQRLVEQEGNYGIWPMCGESCTSFGRTCEYMDVCHLDTANLMAPLRECHYNEPERDGKLPEYQFEIPITELL